MTLTDFFNQPYFYHSGSSLLPIDPNGFRLMSIDQPVPEIWQLKHLTKTTLTVKVDCFTSKQSYCADMLDFAKIGQLKSKMTLKVKVNRPHFR